MTLLSTDYIFSGEVWEANLAKTKRNCIVKIEHMRTERMISAAQELGPCHIAKKARLAPKAGIMELHRET